MKNGFSQRTGIRTSTNLRVDPKVVLGSQILQLSVTELQQAIQTEMMENPALDRLEEFDDEVSLDEILKTIAPSELQPSGESHEHQRSLPNDTSTELDWIDLTSSVDSLWDHLMGQLSVALPVQLLELASYLVGSVNDRGYTTCTVEDAALGCQSSLEDAEVVWTALRQCEPAGVGATDLRDCLILQLRDAQGDAERLARLMLRRNWEDLVARNARAIAKAFKVPAELVEAAFEVITSLNPFPGESFVRHNASGRKDRVNPVFPDVVITLDEAGFLIDVPGPSVVSIRVNPAYEKRRKELAGRQVDGSEKRHITEFVERANRFLDAVSQRRILLAKLGKHLVEKQAGFVKTGEYRFLLPLTRSQLAKDLNVHESTISRATAGKFVQIATRDIVPFDVFFKPALRVQRMIEEILSTENPGNPLSDESISLMLEQRGVKVARRTVNKYRDRTKLLSSRMRKSA